MATRWDREPVWFHGDIAVGNLLVRDGRLAAVLDFGTSGVGDPACDMAIAWTYFRGAARERFRADRGVDAATWSRGRGWCLWKTLITLAGGDRPTSRRSSARSTRSSVRAARGRGRTRQMSWSSVMGRERIRRPVAW